MYGNSEGLFKKKKNQKKKSRGLNFEMVLYRGHKFQYLDNQTKMIFQNDFFIIQNANQEKDSKTIDPWEQ